MKKWTARLLSMLMVFVLSACGNTSKEDGTAAGGGAEDQKESEVTPPLETESTEGNRTENPESTEGKTLVVYFSMPETTNPDNMTQEEDNSVVVIDGEVLGNTQYVAYVIQENTGADIFRIEPETPYPTDHKTLVDLAAQEQDDDARPAIKDNIKNLEQYDTVFVGYPNWWGNAPRVILTFLEQYDLTDKVVIPFCTSGGSTIEESMEDLKQSCAGAEWKDGYTADAGDEEEIREWLTEIGELEPEEEESESGDEEIEKSEEEAFGKLLVAYFSWSGTSERIAEDIIAQTGADYFRIEREIPYSTDYTETAYGDAKDEADNNARPPIKEPLASIEKYDKIIICYPIWWHTAPMTVGTFLESYDLTGKTIYPISQSASMDRTQYEQSVEFIRECAKGASVDDGIFTRDSATIEHYVDGIINKQ